MASCSGPRLRPCSPSPLIPSTWAPRSAFLPCSILGALTCFIIPTYTVWSRLFRRLFLENLVKAFDAAKLQFFSSLESLRDRSSFLDYLAPLREAEWVVYAKRPFAGPEQVLDYVGRYTHRVAISNNRLLDIAEDKVTFRYKDYRHNAQQKAMTLEAGELIRRSLRRSGALSCRSRP